MPVLPTADIGALTATMLPRLAEIRRERLAGQRPSLPSRAEPPRDASPAGTPADAVPAGWGPDAMKLVSVPPAEPGARRSPAGPTRREGTVSRGGGAPDARACSPLSPMTTPEFARPAETPSTVGITLRIATHSEANADARTGPDHEHKRPSAPSFGPDAADESAVPDPVALTTHDKKTARVPSRAAAAKPPVVKPPARSVSSFRSVITATVTLITLVLVGGGIYAAVSANGADSTHPSAASRGNSGRRDSLAPVAASQAPMSPAQSDPARSAGSGGSPTADPAPQAGPKAPQEEAASQDSTTATSQGARPNPPPALIFSGLAGPGCANTASAQYFKVTTADGGGGTGWVSESADDGDGSGCDNGFQAMPMTGSASADGPNRALWLFTFPAATPATCTVRVYIPEPPTGRTNLVDGADAQYGVYEGTQSASVDIATQVAGFAVDQPDVRGSSVTKTGIHVTDKYIAVRLFDRGVTTTSPPAMYGVGAVSFSCTRG